MTGKYVMHELGAKNDITEDDMLNLLMTKCLGRTTIPDEWVKFIDDGLIDYASELYEQYIVYVDMRMGFP